MADRVGTTPPPPPDRLIGEVRVLDGPDAGRMAAVGRELVLGRDESADLVLSDPSGELSRRHARICLRDGVPVIEDLDSTNGTFLNGERIAAAEPLAAADRIRIGGTTLEFVPAPELRPARPSESPTDVTRAREIPTDVTRAREIPADVTRIREVQTDPTRAPEVPAAPASAFAPPGADGELRILAGPGAGRTAAVLGGSATIGREPECDLQVLDSEVSRRHAKVTVRDGRAVIDDLRSSNGTYVNGERILDAYTLVPGDRIQIGEATIELTSPVFAGVPARPAQVQVTGVRDALVQSAKLLGAESGTRRWWTLAVVSMTTFMLLLDVTIVSVALPAISKALRPSFSSLQWIVSAYTLMLTAMLLTAGSMADIRGRKQVLTIGLVVFTAASVLCAQAPNATVLDLARGVQGVGGAMMFACSLALIVQEFPADERSVAFGIFGAVNGLSIALGPIVGGLLVQHIGWQAVFYLNVPTGIATFVILQRKVVNLPGPPTRIDWAGLVTFSGAAFLATFATIRGAELGWGSATILASYGAAVLLALAFVAVELRGAQPMFDLSLLRNSTFLGASMTAIAMSFSLLGLIFFMTVWLQSVLGYSPVQAGVRMLAFTGVALLIAPLAGRMSGTVSPRITLTAGMALIAVGVFSMAAIAPGSSWTVILPGLCLSGLGMGLINPTLGSTAVGVVPPWRSGMATGISSTCREGGTTAGVAVLGIVLLHQVRAHVHSSLSGTVLAHSAASVATAIAAGATPRVLAKVPPAIRPAVRHVAHLSYAHGLHAAFLVAAAMALVGVAAAVALIRRHQIRYGPGAGGH